MDHTDCERRDDKMLAGCAMDGKMSQAESNNQYSHSRREKHTSYTTHMDHASMFKKKFWICLVITLPIVYFSETIAGLLSYQPVQFTGSNFVVPILGTIIFFYGGLVFLKSAAIELKQKQPGMMTLISLAIAVAFVYSLTVTLGLSGMDFWWELATLITIMLLGHWLEMSSIAKASDALGSLAKLLPDTAELIGNESRIIPLTDLKVDDVILVRPGTSVPADGQVIAGKSQVNEALITGESGLVDKYSSSLVIAGTINMTGALTVRVNKLGDDTVISGIMRLVREAETSQSHTQILADRFAGYLFYLALVAATLTAIYWSIFGHQSISFVVERVVTVLVIACPHALGLAVPLVTSISSSLAVKNGLLIRKRQAFEKARTIDVVLFDKTGTLTVGKQGVAMVVGNEQQVIGLAASIECQSEHPIGRAIVDYARQKSIAYSAPKDFLSITGKGVSGVIDDGRVYIGTDVLLKDNNISIAEEYKIKDSQSTLVYVAQKNKVIGTIAISDIIRSESQTAVDAIKKSHIQVGIVTGDSQTVAAKIANQLNIKMYYGQVLPAGKAEIVKSLQASGKQVAFVGDGINDAPALMQADEGIAIGAGTDIAIETAGIILISNNPEGVVKTIKLSQTTYRKMIQNLAWGAGYNVVAIPLAAGVVPGIILSPAIGAVLMSLSTIIVVLNAQLLWRTRL
jgi:Cu2+-exporting ATPase